MTRRHRGTVGQPTYLVDARHDKPPALTPEEVVGRHIQPQPNGCWLYNGEPDTYASISIYHGQVMTAHRFVYQTMVGPIEVGHHIHHECETPGCCNPAHLVMLTPAEHRARHKR